MENRRARRRSQQHPRDGLDEFQRQRAARIPTPGRLEDAYARLDEAEQRLYERWQRDSENGETHDDLVRLLLSHKVMPEWGDGRLWLLGLGEKVAALGGHLEVVAVFDDEDTTLIREPGPEGQPLILETTTRLFANQIEHEPDDGDDDGSAVEVDEAGRVNVDLTPDERGLITSALAHWGGPARPTQELLVAMGFRDDEDFYTERTRMIDAVRDGRPLTPFDWRRALVATEIGFASDYFGIGGEWETCTGIDDDASIQLLREIQDKLIGIANSATPPADDPDDTPVN